MGRKAGHSDRTLSRSLRRSFTIEPAAAERWSDLERLFGPDKGANSGCWCMWWRTTRSGWSALGKTKRKAAFRAIVAGGAVPGILAYDGDRAIGWCAIEPREAYPSLERSRVTRRLDERPVWSITCFYIDPAYRRRGLMALLIDGALAHAARNGAKLVEAYPHDPCRATAGGDVFTGLASSFRRCGFKEVARPTPSRPVMRRKLR